MKKPNEKAPPQITDSLNEKRTLESIKYLYDQIEKSNEVITISENHNLSGDGVVV